MMTRVLLFVALAVLAACGSSTQVLMPTASPTLRVRPVVSSIEIRDVSLPRYAAGDEIVLLTSDGVLDPIRGKVWADTPERVVTLSLAENLATVTGVRVSTEPWPFLEPPQVSITVRVARLLASESGLLHFAGQYAIAPVGAATVDRSGQFDIAVPLAGTSPQAVAQAQAQAVANLSETLARRLAR